MADSNGDGDSLSAVASGAAGTMDEETALSKLAASKQLVEDCKKEESAGRDFLKAVSKAWNVLPDATDFKASLVQPIKALEAAGDVGISKAGDAARSYQSDVTDNTAIVDSFAEEKEAEATWKAATAGRKSLADAVGDKRSRDGGGGDVSQKRSSPTGGAASGSGAGGSGSSDDGSGSGSDDEGVPNGAAAPVAIDPSAEAGAQPEATNDVAEAVEGSAADTDAGESVGADNSDSDETDEPNSIQTDEPDSIEIADDDCWAENCSTKPSYKIRDSTKKEQFCTQCSLTGPTGSQVRKKGFEKFKRCFRAHCHKRIFYDAIGYCRDHES